MFVTPAYAQTMGGGVADLVLSIVPFLLIFVVMYLLVLRPQRQQLARRDAMLKAIRRGDTVVTAGGVVAKVTRVIDDNELELQIAEGVKVRAMRALIHDVRTKGEPATGAA